MPRVKKKSYEYGNRRRRKLAAAKRSVYYYPLMVDGAQSAQQPTGEMPPTPPLTSPDTDDFKSDNDFKNQDTFPKKIEDHDTKKLAPFNTAGIKTERTEGYQAIRPIKGLSDLISKSIITAEDAAAAVTAVTTMASLKKSLAGRKGKIPKQPKQPKPPKQTSVKVSLPTPKTPVLPKPTIPATTTAAPNKLMVNFKGLGNTASSGNTQKAYALYVGGQLKYILPYNGPLGAISSTQQQNNEMKKLICRGVNGKTEIALAKPTVVCDEEKKKIVFVVQKKATTAPASSLLTSSNQTDNKTVRIPSLATLSTTSGQSLQGNQIISDNMLKLLLPAVSASINSNSPITLPSPVSGSGQGQKARTTPQQTSQSQQAPVEKVPASSSSVPIVVKVQSNVSQSMSTATTTTTTTTTTTSSSTPTPTTTTAMTNVTPQTSPVSSSSNSPGSVRPVQLFTRDSARNLCPAPLVLTPGSKPCMTILDPTDPGANIRPGKSLLGNSETSPNVSKQSAYQGEISAGANQILVKKTSGDSSVILQFKDAAGVSSFLSASDKDPKLPDQSSNYTNDTQLQPNPQTVTPVSLPNCIKTETMPAITAPASEEEGSANDEDDGMFGLKISSVFSLAENQPCSTANEAVIDQGRKLVHNSAPASFQQDQIPADTLATAMKLAVSSEEAKPNNETSNADVGDSLSNQRTVIFSLNTDNVSSQSQQDNLQITFDTSPSKQNSLLKSSVAKSSVNVKLEPQTLTSLDPDLESVLTGKLSVDTQTVHSQKENASPKKGASFVGPEKDFLPGQKYITVDIFRHNGQTKITAVSSSGKKDVTKAALPNGNSEGASGSSSDDKSSISTSDPRINEVLQCAAYSLPMGTYFFIPLADKIVAIPSQRRKKNRSAYIFEKNHNFMQVKMAKYMLLNSKDKLPTSVVTSTNGSQLVCQISTPTKANGEPAIVLPVPSASPAKDTIPTLEAPPIVTGKRIRRPKKHTGFEEDMDLIPPLRKCRKKLKPVNKAEKNAKEQMCNDKNSQTITTNFESKDIGLGSSNKLMLQPVDSKEELAAVLRSVDMPTTISKNNNATSLPYVYVHPPSASKVTTSVSSTTETSFQESNQSGLHIDNVQSLQQGGIKIKSEPITSGYGDDEPVKPLCPLLTPAPSVASSNQVGHDALGIPHTIKKEPSWYGYGQDTSSPVLYRMNTSTSTSHSDHMSTLNMNLKKATPSGETYGPRTQLPALYKKDSPTKSPTGKKRGRKKKEPDETKPEVKKRKYVRHKIETVTTPTQTPLSGLMSTLPSFPLKTEMKTEPPEPSLMGSSNQSGETPQEERIRRLKEILREKEQKLEEIRLNLSVSTTI